MDAPTHAHPLTVKRNKGEPDKPLMTQPRAARLKLFPVVCDCQPGTVGITSDALYLSCTSLQTPLLCLFLQPSSYDVTTPIPPHTHPSIIALQQWTRAELSGDSVTVHNGLMADAVREFTGTHARTYAQDNTHTRTYTENKQELDITWRQNHKQTPWNELLGANNVDRWMHK